jgi:hypothetical protein
MKHDFFDLCIDSAVFRGTTTLSRYIGVLLKQSNTDAALIPYREDLNSVVSDAENLGVSDSKIKAPRYYGAGIEALAETYFEIFGPKYHIGYYKSADNNEQEIKDIGIDGYAVTSRQMKSQRSSRIRKVHKVNDPVYVQIKGPLRYDRLFTTNDGSRIPNFMMAAQSTAINVGSAYSARYVLFTTGGGLHYELDANCMNQIEVFDNKKISKDIKGNLQFWNHFYEKIGLDPMQIPNNPDSDWIRAQEEYDELENLG